MVARPAELVLTTVPVSRQLKLAMQPWLWPAAVSVIALLRPLFLLPLSFFLVLLVLSFLWGGSLRTVLCHLSTLSSDSSYQWLLSSVAWVLPKLCFLYAANFSTLQT